MRSPGQLSDKDMAYFLLSGRVTKAKDKLLHKAARTNLFLVSFPPPRPQVISEGLTGRFTLFCAPGLTSPG